MTSWRKSLSLLNAEGRKHLLVAMLTSCAAALAAALMIGSLIPFLTLLAQPEAVDSPGFLSWAQRVFGANSAHELLGWLAGISIILLLLSGGLRIWNVYEIARFTAGQKRLLGQRLLRKYLGRPYSFHVARNSSDLAANLLNEVNEAFRMAYRPAAQLVTSGLTTLALIVVLALVDVWVTLAAFVLIGGLYLAVFVAVKTRIRRLGGVRSDAVKQLYRATGESLQGIKEIKVLGREGHYVTAFDAASLQERNATMVLRVLADVPRYAIQTAVMTAVIVFCILFVSEEMMTSADAARSLVPLIGVFAAAGQRLIPELHSIYNALTTIRFGAAAIDRLYDDLAEGQRDATPTQGPDLRMTATLTLDAVNFRFDGKDKRALHDVSVQIKAGDRIGIAGRSGAGKTTLADIILGLLHPESGALAADGQAITPQNVGRWQRSVGFVPQDIFLADASVAENVALGLPTQDVDRARVQECLDTAQATEFVTGLPNDIDTIIGERGVRLSGGQRQRLAIARALYNSVDILVFDEATSALDTVTEQDLMFAIAGLSADITIILIAHRITTLDVCDRVLVLDQGRVVGDGTKAELLATCSAFQSLAGADH